ncbi:glutamate racemase [Chelatococcus asaccharovorans]|uniref:glutamate racemase n=1 Tax=Chelatococcus asaccharovorans TaxID=28210 RepID=UPI00224C740C|nr:glutamate racemase [Chelatococcus asaccharovorans]CAH1665694.1 Glutamate racemase [Chelatococcus asaccharovorans]CAH1681829.1 Glutamate racemase [Chelatococcus asaccharovorans]
MRIDRPADAAFRPAVMPLRPPKVLVFDSGLGGLTVFAELRKARPDAHFVYAADDAGFPYGRLGESDLIARVDRVMDRLIAQHEPDIVVIACNTASTLVLPGLRARYRLPFVGTVPAIKPAAATSASKRISVLATAGTVKRDYTQALIASFAADCTVTLVGAPRLAGLAEDALTGQPVGDVDIAAEIAPAFVAEGGARTDVVVLACTHYPLLQAELERLAPWPVTWIDSAPAIARRAVQLLLEQGFAPHLGETGASPPAKAVFTGGAIVTDRLRAALAARGLPDIVVDAMPLAGSEPAIEVALAASRA